MQRRIVLQRVRARRRRAPKCVGCAVLLALVNGLAVSSASAHGVVGDYIFLEPLVAEDPTPANEFDIVQPQWTRTAEGRSFSIGTELEKILGTDAQGLPRFSASVATSWQYNSPIDGPNTDGFDNLEMAAKYAFWIVREHELLLSLAATLQLPTGSPAIEEQQHTSLGPSLLWEKALGDLPNRPVLKYMRPVGFQGGVHYLPALGGHTSHRLSADQVVEYSLPYLSNNVHDLGLKSPFRNLFFFTEFNYTQLIAGPPGQTFPSIVMTPGIAYVGYRFELSIGTQLALNDASVPDRHAAILGLIDIFYDSVIPQANWTLWGK